MDSRKIIDYVTNTPHNTNKTILSQMIKEYGLQSVEQAIEDIPSVYFIGTKPSVDSNANKTEWPAELEYVSRTERFKAYVKIKVQGTSSIQFPKRNYTIKLYSDKDRNKKLKKNFKNWGNQSKFCLKANYIDHTHARNIISARLWTEVVRSRADFNNLPQEMKKSPCMGAIDGFPIKVYYNGMYEGIYTWNIPKDAWQWNMDEDNPNHVLMCAETNDNNTSAGFKALWNGIDGEEWSVEVGTNSEAVKQSLNDLITCVKDTDDATFKATIGHYLDIQSAIDYYIHFNMIIGTDNVAKNMLLATYDGVKWICGAYDMDATFGAQYDGKLTYTHANDVGGWAVSLSKLWERLTTLYKAEINKRYFKLRETVYSDANIINLFEDFTDLIGSELYAEDVELFPGIPEADNANFKQLRNIAHERGWFMDRKIEAPLFPLESGEKVFTDGYTLKVENGYQITMTCDNAEIAPAASPSVNISKISTNKDNCASGANNINWNNEMFSIAAGDKVRVVVESKDVMECPIKLVSKDGTLRVNITPSGWHGLCQYDYTYEMKEGEDMMVGTITFQGKPKQTVSFKVKIYINGVRYV